MTKSIRITLSSVCLPELSWRDIFRTAAESGYTAVELLMIPGWVHLQPGEVPGRVVREEAERCGLSLIAVHAGGLDGASDEQLAASISYIDRVSEFACEAGIPMVNFNGGLTPADMPRELFLKRIGDTLEQYESKLSGSGLRFTVENHFGYQLETVEDYRNVFGRLREARHIGITLDTGHFTAAQVDMPDFIREFGKQIIHVHMKDHIGRTSVAFGKGDTDNLAVVTALRELNYDGDISVELEVHDRENAVRYVQEAQPYVANLLKVTL